MKRKWASSSSGVPTPAAPAPPAAPLQLPTHQLPPSTHQQPPPVALPQPPVPIPPSMLAKYLPSHLLVAAQWPMTLGGSIRHQTLHGAWPTVKATPVHNAAKVNPRNFTAALKALLRVYWPNVLARKPSDHYSFWRYQWLNHGQYTGLPVEVYFYTVVWLFLQVPQFTDLGLQLDNPTVIANMRQSIKVSQFPFTPEVSIRFVGATQQFYVMEFRFLTDKLLSYVDKGIPLFSLCQKSERPPNQLADTDQANIPGQSLPRI